MKQALEETADGTPDAAPAVIKPTKRGVAMTR